MKKTQVQQYKSIKHHFIQGEEGEVFKQKKISAVLQILGNFFLENILLDYVLNKTSTLH